MAIKVSELLKAGSVTSVGVITAGTNADSLIIDNSPITGSGNILVTVNGFSSTIPGVVPAAGPVQTNFLRSDGEWVPVTGGGGTVTSIGLISSGSSISISGTPSPITIDGTFDIDLPLSSVIPATYGSSSAVGVFTVNDKGIITSASTSSISITPSQVGLGNVTNALQVINAGGAPSIREGSGVPTGTDTLGAIYIDRAVTNGDGIYFYDGAVWAVVATKANLYDEKINGFTAPVAAATNSVAIGSGAETATSAQGSLAIGLQSLARTPGGVVQASGRFSNNGDAQTGRYLLRGNTTSNIPQELFVDGTGGTVRLNLPDNSTWTFKITVTGHRTDLGDGHAGYTASGVIYRGSGVATTTIQGAVNKIVLAESNPSWDININANTVNGALRILVTGENSKIIRWLALVETVEITN